MSVSHLPEANLTDGMVKKYYSPFSWSIENTVKNVPEMTSEAFYKILMRYVLTPEQCEENGYPTPGKKFFRYGQNAP
jgi:hypothetical protein